MKGCYVTVLFQWKRQKPISCGCKDKNIVNAQHLLPQAPLDPGVQMKWRGFAWAVAPLTPIWALCSGVQSKLLFCLFVVPNGEAAHLPPRGPRAGSPQAATSHVPLSPLARRSSGWSGRELHSGLSRREPQALR